VSKQEIKSELDKVIGELETKGITQNTKEEEYTGLGDVIENTLTQFGITEDRFKEWFGLQECSCTKRKKYLNSLFKWKRDKN